MTQKEFEEELNQLEDRAKRMNLIWHRITGVASSQYGEYDWASYIILVKRCVDAAEDAVASNESPHPVVNRVLMSYLCKQVKKKLSRGRYDDAA